MCVSCFVFSAAAVKATGEPTGTGESPDVLIILVDDLGYNDNSLQAESAVDTPNLERLADQGIVFEQGYVTHSYCGPSRAGLLTGRHQARFGMETNPAYSPYDQYHGLPLEEITIAERMADAGYRTGIIGKWHLGAAPEFHPLSRGFEEFFGFLSGGHNYFKVDFTAAQRKNGQLLYSPIEGELLPLNDGRSATGFEGYLTDVLTDKAIEFIESPDQRPYFLYVAYNAPHGPLQAPAELIEKYRDKGGGARSTYLAMIDSLDSNIGRILRALEDSGKRDNTLVFFLGDNGGTYPTLQNPSETWADNTPLRAGKGSFYEGGIRVPFIGSWPARWPQGERYDPMVSSLDIATTALAAAGEALDNEGSLDGKNLTLFLNGLADGVPHDYLFWRSPYNNAFAIRTDRYKLLRNGAVGSEIELYNIVADPSEETDLFISQTDTARELAETWNVWNRSNQRNRTMEAFHYQKVRDQFFREQAEQLVERANRKAPVQIYIE